MVGIFADFEVNANWFAVLVQIKSHFTPIKSNRAISDSFSS